MTCNIIFSLALLTCLTSFGVKADVWYWQDHSGEMHFAKTQQSPKWKLLLRTPGRSQLPQRFQIKQPIQAEFTDRFIARAHSAINQTAENTKSTSPFSDLIRETAHRYGLSADLLKAVIQVESSFRHKAVSKAGAMGLMQLMPGTARRFNVTDPFEPAENINAGGQYLRMLLNEFHSLPLALAAYNAGENAVRRYQGIPPYRETQRYVKKVMALLD